MPPRAKRPAEDKEKAFENWKGTPEWAQIVKVDDARSKNAEASTIEMSLLDINTDWSELLFELHKLVEVMKVPAVKTKCKPFFFFLFFIPKVQRLLPQGK